MLNGAIVSACWYFDRTTISIALRIFNRNKGCNMIRTLPMHSSFTHDSFRYLTHYKHKFNHENLWDKFKRDVAAYDLNSETKMSSRLSSDEPPTTNSCLGSKNQSKNINDKCPATKCEMPNYPAVSKTSDVTEDQMEHHHNPRLTQWVPKYYWYCWSKLQTGLLH